MNKTKYEWFFTFLKLFIFMFVCIIVFSVLSMLVWHVVKNKPLDISKLTNVSYVFAFSLIWSLVNAHRYTKTLEKIETDKQEKDDLILKLKSVLRKMHWQIEEDTDNQIIFRSSIFQEPWKEKIIVQIEAEEVNLIGARFYIEKVLKKLAQIAYTS